MNQEVLRERLERIGFEIVPDRQVNKTTKLIMSESEYRKLEKLISEYTAVVEKESRREIFTDPEYEKILVNETVAAVLNDIRSQLKLISKDSKLTRRSIEQILNLVESEYLDE